MLSTGTCQVELSLQMAFPIPRSSAVTSTILSQKAQPTARIACITSDASGIKSIAAIPAETAESSERNVGSV